MPCAWPKTPPSSTSSPAVASRSVWARAGTRSRSPPSARASMSVVRSSPTISRPCAHCSQATGCPPTTVSTLLPRGSVRASSDDCGRRRSPQAVPVRPGLPVTVSCSRGRSRGPRTIRRHASTRCSCRSSTPISPSCPRGPNRASSPPAPPWSPTPRICPGCARSPSQRCGPRPTASSAMTPRH